MSNDSVFPAGACFLCESDSSERDYYGGSPDQCPVCPHTFERSQPQRTLEHIGAHILSGDVDQSMEPCGFCLRPAPMCEFRLQKSKGKDRGYQVDLKKSRGCPNLVRFSYKAASTFSEAGPCTNVPIKCDLCRDDAPTVWRYNMEAHFIKAHPNAPLESFESLWRLSREETLGMGKILSASRPSAATSKARASDAQLQISEAHSSRLALRSRLVDLFLYSVPPCSI